MNLALYDSSTADLAYHDIVHVYLGRKFCPYSHLMLKTSLKACSSQGEFKDIYYVVKTTRGGGIEGLTVCLIDSGQGGHISAVNVMNGDKGRALTSV